MKFMLHNRELKSKEENPYPANKSKCNEKGRQNNLAFLFITKGLTD
jgi:hypothetical protein